MASVCDWVRKYCDTCSIPISSSSRKTSFFKEKIVIRIKNHPIIAGIFALGAGALAFYFYNSQPSSTPFLAALPPDIEQCIQLDNSTCTELVSNAFKTFLSNKKYGLAESLAFQCIDRITQPCINLIPQAIATFIKTPYMSYSGYVLAEQCAMRDTPLCRDSLFQIFNTFSDRRIYLTSSLPEKCAELKASYCQNLVFHAFNKFFNHPPTNLGEANLLTQKCAEFGISQCIEFVPKAFNSLSDIKSEFGVFAKCAELGLRTLSCQELQSLLRRYYENALSQQPSPEEEGLRNQAWS